MMTARTDAGAADDRREGVSAGTAGAGMSPDHSLYYRDLVVGQVHRSSARTLTEADLTMFSMLSGDWNPVHADADRMEPFGGRLLHGVLGVAVVTGLMDRAGWFAESAIAMIDLKEWTFLRPLHIGDTVRVQMEIIGMRIVSAGDRGLVDRRFELIDQHGAVVQRGTSGMLIRLEPGARHG